MNDRVEHYTEYTRFWGHATPEPNSGCWLWVGAITDNGYGSFWADGRSHRAHRFAYAQFVGPIPSGLTLDHLCRNRICVNPKHLEPVTDRENILRGVGPTAFNAKKTRCIHGHELTPENIIVGREGQRHCRKCNRLRCRLKRIENKRPGVVRAREEEHE